MIRALLITLVIGAVALPGPAQAGCGWGNGAQMINGMLQVHASLSCGGGTGGASGSTTAGLAPPRDSDWDSVCVRIAIAVGQPPAAFCDLPPSAAPAAAAVTPGRVARAFRRLSLPAAELVVQPPNGRTLVNFETNFFTEQGEFTRSVRLLGREVELRIWPESFTWRFGDGVERSTSEPGAAYPNLQVTHRYARKGRVAPSVDVTYAAQFRVGGGEWRDVDGTVTVPGAPESLRVVTARPVLVGG